MNNDEHSRSIDQEPMGSDVGFGPRLSATQYDARMCSWRKAVNDDDMLERVQHDLMVMYKLGPHFPSERSEELFKAMRRGQRLAMLFMAPMAVSSFVLRRSINGLDPTGQVRRACGHVLDDHELDLWFS